MSGLLSIKVGVTTMIPTKVSRLDTYTMIPPTAHLVLLLDLFIYLNFEQKQHSIHHRNSSTSITCTVEISRQPYLFYTAWHHT